MSDNILTAPEQEKPVKQEVLLTNAELPKALEEMNDSMLAAGIITDTQHTCNLGFIDAIYAERKRKGRP